MNAQVQRWPRYVALAALLGAMALLSWVTLAALERVPDAGEAKLRAAHRVIAYRVFPDRGPVFRIDGGRARLKLVTHAVIDGVYDASRITSYGVRLTVHDGDRVVWTSDVYMQTRESKAGWDGVRWRDEAAWGSEPIEIADERVMILDLPATPVDATLSLTLMGQPREVLVRIYREQPRTETQRRATERRLDAAKRAELIGSSTFVPWQMLSDVEQDARLVQRWLHIAAVGQGGVDFTTRTIFVTEFRTPFAAAASVEGIEVSPGHDAAVNVRGPARLVVTQVGGAAATLDVSAVGAGGAARIAIAPDGSLDVGGSPVTLVFSSKAPAPVRFTLAGPPEVQIAVVDARPPVLGQLVPDHVRVPLVVTGVGAVVSARPRDLARAPLIGRVLRVDARVIISADVMADEPVVTAVTVTYLARDGRRLGGDHVTVGGAASRFERLAFGPASAAVTEPTSFRVLAPEGTVRVDLAAERDVAVRLYRWAPGAETLEEPYRVVPVVGARWRYARLVERRWFPMLPSNHDVLAAAGRLAVLDAQVRLEPVGRRPARGTAAYVSLTPLGNPEQQRAREPVAPDELAAVLSAWPPGALTELAAGIARSIEFSPAINSRPRLSWVTDPASVGGELGVTIDGARTHVPLTATRGAVELPRIAPGRHRVSVDGPANALWIDRPPAEDARGVVRDRTLYALGLDGLRVRVRQRPGEEVHVYAIIYADRLTASTKSTVVMTVDGRRPVRRAGVMGRLTAPVVRVAVPAARRDVPAVLVDLGGRSAGTPRSVGIGLLADLEPGLHEIDLNRIGGTHDEPLWVRFVTTQRKRATAAPVKLQTTRTGPRLELIDEDRQLDE